jgi:hypothetical protein
MYRFFFAIFLISGIFVYLLLIVRQLLKSNFEVLAIMRCLHVEYKMRFVCGGIFCLSVCSHVKREKPWTNLD